MDWGWLYTEWDSYDPGVLWVRLGSHCWRVAWLWKPCPWCNGHPVPGELDDPFDYCPVCYDGTMIFWRIWRYRLWVWWDIHAGLPLHLWQWKETNAFTNRLYQWTWDKNRD
jgi:hypothetical protein